MDGQVTTFLSTDGFERKLDLGSDRIDSVGFEWIATNLLKYIARNRLHFNDKQVQEIWRDPHNGLEIFLGNPKDFKVKNFQHKITQAADDNGLNELFQVKTGPSWDDYTKPAEQLVIDLSTNDKQSRFCKALNKLIDFYQVESKVIDNLIRGEADLGPSPQHYTARC